MKIGVCVGLDTMEGFDQKMKNLVEQGFDNCQLISWNPSVWTDENSEIVNKKLKEYGIEVSAFWCGWEGPAKWNFTEGPQTLGLIPEEYREMRIKNLCDGADFAKKLGIENIVTHMGFIPENPNDPILSDFCKTVKIIADHLKQNGQRLLFETGQETPVAMLRCFEMSDCDNLGVNLDTANLILYGKANPVDALDVFGKYVYNLHAKDGTYPTNGTELGHETRLGDGKVDFEAVIKKLYGLGYNSYVTIEREISGEQQIEDIKHAKKYLEDIIEKVCC